MKDKAESSLNSLRREEMQSKHAYELLKQSLTDAMAVGEKEIAEAQAAKGAAAENQAKAQGNLSKTQASKKADEDYVATLENDCSNKAAEWSARQQQANAEIAALTKGAEVLQGGVKVFVQKKSALRRVASSDDKEEARQSVFKLLKKLGRQNNSFALMEMANAVTKDPFGKVRGLIEAMIAKLEKQAQDEATHEAFCKEEQAKSAKSRDTKQSTADKYQARIDEAKATLGELKNEIAELTAEINEIVKANAAATKLRQQEKADFTNAQKDYKDSVEAVGVSISTLKEYYRGETALVQQPSFGSAHTDASDMIIGILETAEAEFGKTLAEIETNETEAVESYEKLMQENKVSQATKEAEIKGKTSEIKSLEVSLANYSDDLQTVNKELDAVLDYIEKLKPQCANKAMTYEERKAKRETEMEGLQTALEILSGEAPAV
jgi:septal ring factor EnvC (AmiA/AmiB activator)